MFCLLSQAHNENFIFYDVYKWSLIGVTQLSDCFLSRQNNLKNVKRRKTEVQSGVRLFFMKKMEMFKILSDILQQLVYWAQRKTLFYICIVNSLAVCKKCIRFIWYILYQICPAENSWSNCLKYILTLLILHCQLG